MTKYLSAKQVGESFKRLRSRKTQGKVHLERTSVIMYFLAFDAVCKKLDQERLDLNPDREEGKRTRKNIELEFSKLVLIERNGKEIKQVLELGALDSNNKDPEKRISSNFLTVPLKKASDHSEPYLFPKRPPAPLMRLGRAATGLKWGMDRYSQWSQNLPLLLSQIKESTPFTDLAFFIFRDSKIETEISPGYIEVFSTLFRKRFTKELADLWIDRLNKERILAKHILNPFVNDFETFCKYIVQKSDETISDSTKLHNYIDYLQKLLVENKIEFDQI
jgi:hypothetical protein